MANPEIDSLPSNTINDHKVNGHDSSGKERNAWEASGSAAFDFRSDTVTSPTASMLAATQSCTLLDDVFAEDPTTCSLESYIADMTGKEAALFVISGTMGNQLSIRTALGGPPHSLLADSRSHIIGWEAGGIASLSGVMPIPVTPQSFHHLTLSDVKDHAVLSSDSHYAPTRLISLENTLGGMVLPLAECYAISDWARSQDPPIWMHLDGARLWEAVAAGAGQLKDYCACFDSVTMCFSKGLGAPIGSIIVSDAPFIKKARHLRKMMGGGLRQAGVVTSSAKVAVEETFLGGKLSATHQRAQKVATIWERKGGKIQYPTETNMVWLDLEDAGVSVERLVQAGAKEGLKLFGGRIVVHYQIEDEAIEKLGRVMDAILPSQKREMGEITNGMKKMASKNMEPELE